jgi:hypothetical protein
VWCGDDREAIADLVTVVAEGPPAVLESAWQSGVSERVTKCDNSGYPIRDALQNGSKRHADTIPVLVGGRQLSSCLVSDLGTLTVWKSRLIIYLRAASPLKLTSSQTRRFSRLGIEKQLMQLHQPWSWLQQRLLLPSILRHWQRRRHPRKTGHQHVQQGHP